MRTALIALLIVVSAGVARGQEDASVPPAVGGVKSEATTPARLPPVEVRFTTGGGQQFESGLDGGGDYSFGRVQALAGVEFQAAERLGIDLGLGYEYDRFEFSGSGTLAGLDPWRDVHGIRVRATGTYIVTRQWSVFGGAFFTLAGEEGADFGEALTGGGLVGARWARDADHYVGFGFALQTRLEERGLTGFPIILLNWKLSERWKLQNAQYDLGSAGGAGIEIAHLPSDDWEIAAGVQYGTRRFRLSESGPVPGGIGNQEILPLYVAARWSPDRNVELTAFAGLVAWSQLEVADSNGLTIAEEDGDPAAAIGLALRVKF